MTKHFTFLISLLLFSCVAHAQKARIYGRVTDAETKEELMQAAVVVNAAKGLATVTDAEGKYELNVEPGSYQVVFKYTGKAELSMRVSLSAGGSKELNVSLSDRQELMNTVVVSGSKYEKKMSEETVSMDVVKGQNLQNQNITNLENGMKRVPGVTIADGQVNIRGGAGWSYGAGSRVLVMVDNLPLLSADAADAKWAIIPMENVEQIEIIKGAASALYGSSALNGVINVRTAYATDKPFTRVSTYMGAYDQPQTRSNNWFRIQPQFTGGLNFADRRKFGQVDLVTGFNYETDMGHNDSSDATAVRGNVKFRYRFKKLSGLNIGVNFGGYTSWGKTFFFWKGIDSNAYKPFPNTITIYKSYRFTVDPFLTYTDSKDNKFSWFGRFFNATNTNTTGQGSTPNVYYNDFQYQKLWKNLDMNLVAGNTIIYNQIIPPPNDSVSLFGKHNVFNYSIYAQVDKKWFGRLNTTLGVRWEYFDVDNGLRTSIRDKGGLKYPLVRVGLNYQAAEATFIRGSFGQGFRYPTIAELFISTAVGPLTISSNPNALPEKGYSAEIGVKQGFKFGRKSSWAGFVDAAVFYNQYDNMMEFTFGQFGDKATWNKPITNFGLGFSTQNVGQTRIIGTEIMFALQGKAGPLDIGIVGGYNFIDPRSMNWDDNIDMYNYQGEKIKPYINWNGLILNPTNIENSPNSQDQNLLTYGMTSTSSNNILKYRSRHNFKVDLNVGWKYLELNLNLQYTSFMENIDYAFVSDPFKVIGGGGNLDPQQNAFTGVEEFRKRQLNRGISGDMIFNGGLTFKPLESLRFTFICNNILNWEYTPRPASLGAPRNYTLQVTFTPDYDKLKK